MSKGFVDYGSNYNYMKKWTASGDGEDILCRSLAWLLFQTCLSVQRPLPEQQWACWNENAYLYSDLGVFEQDPRFRLSPEQQAVYFTLFAPVEADASAAELTEQTMFQAILEQWTANGVRFADSPLSMVSLDRT